jgi:hypothetical protein
VSQSLLLFPVAADDAVNADPLDHAHVREAVELVNRMIRIWHINPPKAPEIYRFTILLAKLVQHLPLDPSSLARFRPHISQEEAWILNLEALANYPLNETIKRLRFDLAEVAIVDKPLGPSKQHLLAEAILLLRSASDYAGSPNLQARFLRGRARDIADHLGYSHSCKLLPGLANTLSRDPRGDADRWWEIIKYFSVHSYIASRPEGPLS